MLRVYCDTGAFTDILASLEQQGKLTIYQFKYENQNRKLRRSGIPSDLQYEDLKNYTYDDFANIETLKELTYDQLGGVNSKIGEVLSIVGRYNRRDAQHIDSAQMTGCTVFLTSDKADIWSKRDRLHKIFGLRVFLMPGELTEFVSFVESKHRQTIKPSLT